MEKGQLEKFAEQLFDAWAREAHGQKVKWGHISSEERSVWRHVARVAETAVRGGGKAASKPAAKVTPFPAKR